MTAASELVAAMVTLVLDNQIVPCGRDPDPWFADTASQRADAAQQCAGCAVLDLCSAAADEAGERWGVWGGADRQDRPTAKGHR